MATYTRTWYGRKLWWAHPSTGTTTGPFVTRSEAEDLEREVWAKNLVKLMERSELERARLLKECYAERGQKMIPMFTAWRAARPAK